MDVIADVPDFAYGLPLRSEGADLMPLTPRAPKQYQTELTLTVDHRVLDGAAAAAFLRDLTNLLTEPLRILV